MTRLESMKPDAFDRVVETFCAAFHDYPVMRFILADAGSSYDDRLLALIAYFTAARFTRGYPVLGLFDDDRLIGVANVNPARSVEEPEELVARYRRLVEELGPAAIERFQRFERLTSHLEPGEPHTYLGMIGVDPAEQGKGHARRLLEAVHALSADDPGSAGVTLTTESPKNVLLYEHFGYRVLGEAQADDLTSWLMFRPDSS